MDWVFPLPPGSRGSPEDDPLFQTVQRDTLEDQRHAGRSASVTLIMDSQMHRWSPEWICVAGNKEINPLLFKKKKKIEVPDPADLLLRYHLASLYCGFPVLYN